MGIGIGSGSVFAPLFDIVLAALGDHEVGTGCYAVSSAVVFLLPRSAREGAPVA